MKRLLPSAILFLLLNISFNGYALEAPYKVKGQHFTIYYEEDVNLLNVAHNVSIPSSVYLLDDKGKEADDGDGGPVDILKKNIDVLFNEVSDILDMHLYSYNGNIKICRNKEQLKEEYHRLFNTELLSESFYYYGENAIFLNAENLTPGIASHEIAHAIINHYFVVVPPIKVQEVLAAYVEYNINKY